MIVQCSECGRNFEVLRLNCYMYKTGAVKVNSRTKTLYQCSYTCYDHSCLRNHSVGYITRDKFVDYVNKCEETMEYQGKKVLHPIDINEKFKN